MSCDLWLRMHNSSHCIFSVQNLTYFMAVFRNPLQAKGSGCIIKVSDNFVSDSAVDSLCTQGRHHTPAFRSDAVCSGGPYTTIRG